MIMMKCNIGDERAIVLTYCGRKVLKNNDIIHVDEKDLTNPEVSYLVKNGILVMVSDSKEEEVTIQSAIQPEADVFKCTLKEGKRIAINSIKGTVSAGETIEINKRDQTNSDIDNCIRSGILVPLTDNGKEEKFEKFTIAVEKPNESSQKNQEECNNEQDAVQDVKIDEMKTSANKELQPKFRVEDSVTNAFKKIAKDVYSNSKQKKKKTIKKATPDKKQNTSKKEAVPVKRKKKTVTKKIKE